MKREARLIFLRLVLVLLVLTVTKLMWDSPFYSTPADKALNVIKGWAIGVGVLYGPLYLYRRFPDRFGWLDAKVNVPLKRFKSRKDMVQGVFDDEAPVDLFGMQTGIYSEDGWMHPDARNQLARMRRERAEKERQMASNNNRV